MQAEVGVPATVDRPGCGPVAVKHLGEFAARHDDGVPSLPDLGNAVRRDGPEILGLRQRRENPYAEPVQRRAPAHVGGEQGFGPPPLLVHAHAALLPVRLHHPLELEPDELLHLLEVRLLGPHVQGVGAVLIDGPPAEGQPPGELSHNAPALLRPRRRLAKPLRHHLLLGDAHGLPRVLDLGQLLPVADELLPHAARVERAGELVAELRADDPDRESQQDGPVHDRHGADDLARDRHRHDVSVADGGDCGQGPPRRLGHACEWRGRTDPVSRATDELPLVGWPVINTRRRAQLEQLSMGIPISPLRCVNQPAKGDKRKQHENHGHQSSRERVRGDRDEQAVHIGEQAQVHVEQSHELEHPADP
mmetsp:Transcript_61937/g.171317  ORF Transcript_61937/g.171317 Transcript_61937/m.171317 type:complete len:363 (+) Transcript_61937:239-1327(+)